LWSRIALLHRRLSSRICTLTFKQHYSALYMSTSADETRNEKKKFKQHQVLFGDNYKRSHYCADVSKEELIGQYVQLNAWVENIRHLSQNLIFLVLRDRSGKVQVVYQATDGVNDSLIAKLNELAVESVVFVRGQVRKRPGININETMLTGSYEIVLNDLVVLNEAIPLPLQLANAQDEELLLKYRYLEMRRPQLLNNLKIRSQALGIVRDYFVKDNGFLEIETPTLFKSTPEGAREYLVPTRHKGKFYALTQSPQQYKQLLMMGGVDKYFQIARCYRDETGRGDRQPEFTQIDLEMSFITQQDIYNLIEGIMKRLWKEILNVEVQTPFPHMKYKDALETFGSDKPDTRFGMQFVNVSEMFVQEQCGIGPINDTVQNPTGIIYAFKASKGARAFSKDSISTLQSEAKQKSKGTIYAYKYPFSKSFSDKLTENQKHLLKEKLQLEDEDLVVFGFGTNWSQTLNALGRARLLVKKEMEEKQLLKLDPKQYNFLWVVDFPMFETEEGGQAGLETSQGLSSMHHPFTAPHPDDIKYLIDENGNMSTNFNDVTKVRGLHYDIVLNGVELGGGSIRIYNAALQRHVLQNILQLGEQRTQERFQHLLDALSYGAPPHGGIALGFDRLVAMLCHANNIRQVLAFPKTATGNEPLSQAPSDVDEQQLKELHLKILS
jgi:aspartyl-tRNA synthetase